jgi:hypothetical protein
LPRTVQLAALDEVPRGLRERRLVGLPWTRDRILEVLWLTTVELAVKDVQPAEPKRK